MSRLGLTSAVVAIVAAISLTPSIGVCDDGSAESPPAPVKIACAVEAGVLVAYPDAVIEACAQTTGKPGKLDPMDEFAVQARLGDGTTVELEMTRGAPADNASTSHILRTTKVTAHSDRVESPGVLMALLFWVFALITVGGALFVVSRRNLIAAVMGMVGSFVGIAAVYMMLYASFLAVIQMLVYAGAIMVLFVFVVMILNRPEDEPVAPTGRAGQVIGSLAIVYLVGRLIMLLMHVDVPLHGAAGLAAPRGVAINPAEVADWGSVKAVGTDLFGPGLFPFEAISILLLVAVVGAIAIARPLHEIEVPEGTDPNDPRVEGHSI